MRKLILVAVPLFVALPVHAKDRPAYEKGVLIQMNSSSCGYVPDQAQGRQASGSSSDRRNRGFSHSQG